MNYALLSPYYAARSRGRRSVIPNWFPRFSRTLGFTKKPNHLCDLLFQNAICNRGLPTKTVAIINKLQYMIVAIWSDKHFSASPSPQSCSSMPLRWWLPPTLHDRKQMEVKHRQTYVTFCVDRTSALVQGTKKILKMWPKNYLKFIMKVHKQHQRSLRKWSTESCSHWRAKLRKCPTIRHEIAHLSHAKCLCV